MFVYIDHHISPFIDHRISPFEGSPRAGAAEYVYRGDVPTYNIA